MSYEKTSLSKQEVTTVTNYTCLEYRQFSTLIKRIVTKSECNGFDILLW